MNALCPMTRSRRTDNPYSSPRQKGLQAKRIAAVRQLGYGGLGSCLNNSAFARRLRRLKRRFGADKELGRAFLSQLDIAWSNV